MVFKPAALQKVLDDVSSGFAGDIRAIESKLQVDLRADLDDDARAIAP